MVIDAEYHRPVVKHHDFWLYWWVSEGNFFVIQQGGAQ